MVFPVTLIALDGFVPVPFVVVVPHPEVDGPFSVNVMDPANAPFVALIDGYVELPPLEPGSLAAPDRSAVSYTGLPKDTGVLLAVPEESDACVVRVGVTGLTEKHSGFESVVPVTVLPEPVSVAPPTPPFADSVLGVKAAYQQYRPAEVNVADPDVTVGLLLLTATPTLFRVPFAFTPLEPHVPVAIGPQR